jgi:hypothetical protein
MKTAATALVALGLLLLAGCASAPETADIRVQAGMSRDDLRAYYGEPLRIQPGAAGGEDWYYRFVAWKARPTGESGTREDFGEKTSYASAGLSFSQETEEQPIHVSPAGYVRGPVPKGKVVKN